MPCQLKLSYEAVWLPRDPNYEKQKPFSAGPTGHYLGRNASRGFLMLHLESAELSGMQSSTSNSTPDSSTLVSLSIPDLKSN